MDLEEESQNLKTLPHLPRGTKNLKTPLDLPRGATPKINPQHQRSPPEDRLLQSHQAKATSQSLKMHPRSPTKIFHLQSPQAVARQQEESQSLKTHLRLQRGTPKINPQHLRFPRAEPLPQVMTRKNPRMYLPRRPTNLHLQQLGTRRKAVQLSVLPKTLRHHQPPQGVMLKKTHPMR
jgi:hypothetical protein